MRENVDIQELGRAGPRVLLLPGLGARGSGFRRLAESLADVARPLLVEYPEGRHAGVGAGELARQVAEAAGEVDAAVVSSFGGMVGAHLASRGRVRGVAFLGSFTRLEHLGLRGSAFSIMAPIAELGRPGWGAAMIAANGFVKRDEVEHVVPTTALERRSVWHRAFAIPREPAPPELRELPVSCLAIHGACDWLVPVAVLPKVVASLPAGTRSHVLPWAGHVPYFTHPRECAALLRPWLEGLSGSPEATGRAA